jgi:glutathione reductase (NADPH)
MRTYDLIVLGSGGAGYQVATKAREAGWDVAVVNDGPFGGTCAVRGCIPKKVLAGSAEVADTHRRLQNIGIIDSDITMNWQETIAFKRSFTDSVSGSTKDALNKDGIDTYEGSPRFTDNLTLEVNGETISGKNLHIAVGAKPASLPIPGFEHAITSDDFLELDDLPKRIVFVGGGYVSFELAHVAARFGSEVTILQNDDKPLAIFDRDVISTLLEATKSVGIQVELNHPVGKVERNNAGFNVTANDTVFPADLVVNGAGRPPAIADLNLEATGVDYDKRRGVSVDANLQSTSNPNVTAAGDAADAGPPLSPVAGVQGGIVAHNLLHEEKRSQPSYLSTPSVIFTTPTVGMVGHSQASAEAAGLDVTVVSNDITGWFDSKRLGIKHAMSKIIVENKTDKILGAHLIGNHAEDLINIFALAVELELTREQLKAPIMAFPTASDDLRSML